MAVPSARLPSSAYNPNPRQLFQRAIGRQTEPPFLSEIPFKGKSFNGSSSGVHGLQSGEKERKTPTRMPDTVNAVCFLRDTVMVGLWRFGGTDNGHKMLPSSATTKLGLRLYPVSAANSTYLLHSVS